MIDTENKTLNEVLHELGYDTATGPFSRRKNIFDPKSGKCVLMDATAHETWTWLRNSGQIN